MSYPFGPGLIPRAPSNEIPRVGKPLASTITEETPPCLQILWYRAVGISLVAWSAHSWNQSRASPSSAQWGMSSDAVIARPPSQAGTKTMVDHSCLHTRGNRYAYRWMFNGASRLQRKAVNGCIKKY